MPKGKIGFEQLNENLKQKIELGGSGGGGGVGFLKNTVTVTSSTNTVKIGLQFEPGTDALLVFKNSTYQELDHDYIIDETGKYIHTTSGQWIASNEAPVTFNFIVLRTVPLANSIASNTGAVGFIRKTILVEQDTNEIELDLMYNKVTDAILVFRNSVLIEAEEDYTIDMDRQVLINPNANWVAGTLLNLMVFKSVPVEDVKFDGEIIEDGTISIDKLSPEFNVLINNLVKDFETSMVQINQDIKNLENTMNNTINNNMANMQNQINDLEILLASKQNKTDNGLKTSNKTVTGAINEVFLCAENFSSYKQGIAEVIGSPISSSDTISDTKTKINNLKNTLVNKLKEKGVTTTASQSLNNIINKVSEIQNSGTLNEMFNIMFDTHASINDYSKHVLWKDKDTFIYKNTDSYLRTYNCKTKSGAYILNSSNNKVSFTGSCSRAFKSGDKYVIDNNVYSSNFDLLATLAGDLLMKDIADDTLYSVSTVYSDASGQFLPRNNVLTVVKYNSNLTENHSFSQKYTSKVDHKIAFSGLSSFAYIYKGNLYMMSQINSYDASVFKINMSNGDLTTVVDKSFYPDFISQARFYLNEQEKRLFAYVNRQNTSNNGKSYYRLIIINLDKTGDEFYSSSLSHTETDDMIGINECNLSRIDDVKYSKIVVNNKSKSLVCFLTNKDSYTRTHFESMPNIRTTTSEYAVSSSGQIYKIGG